MRRRGFTLMEVLMAAGLLLFATWAFLDIYTTTTHFDVHSQNRGLATMIGQSVMEEIEAHPFGAPAPADWALAGNVGAWAEHRVPLWVEGRPVETLYHLQWNLQDGSFVGTGSGAESDVVTVVISWRENQGANPDYGEFSDRFAPGDTRHLVVQVPVWR